MICILHGYLLEGSGSNLWTRAIVESLCREGETVHLMAQENHPERYPFVTEARRYRLDGTVEAWTREEAEGDAEAPAGCCILHRPEIGPVLPVYVWDRYEEFERVVPLVDLSEEEIERYVERNVGALLRIVRENGITALHANHALLMSVVAQRVSEQAGIPYAVMPHGSALEYAVRRDPRLRRMARRAFAEADRIFVQGDEMRGRVLDVFSGLEGLEEKMREMRLGVDTRRFQPVARRRRPENIQRLGEALQGVPRGKGSAQSRATLEAVAAADTEEALLAAFASAPEYEGKAPDADLEEKLAGIDWVEDSILLFVGRLISAKGVQMLIAALPLLLERDPGLRLLVVGHGPLREPLEAMLWALQRGRRDLVERIVARGRELEGSPEGEEEDVSLTKVRHFYDALRERGELERYYQVARDRVRPECVVFTGYLTHRELRFLFPCCDAAAFPSIVREAGPLVFLEALASGVFPVGTYLGGMEASIDTVARHLPEDDAAHLRLDPDPRRTTAELVAHLPPALALGERHRDTLRQVAVENYDWQSVARSLDRELHALG